MDIKITESITLGTSSQYTIGKRYFGVEFKWHFLGVHIFPRFDPKYPEYFWGFVEEWYDGPLYSFGIGPFFCLVWR